MALYSQAKNTYLFYIPLLEKLPKYQRVYRKHIYGINTKKWNG